MANRLLFTPDMDRQLLTEPTIRGRQRLGMEWRLTSAQMSNRRCYLLRQQKVGKKPRTTPRRDYTRPMAQIFAPRPPVFARPSWFEENLFVLTRGAISQ